VPRHDLTASSAETADGVKRRHDGRVDHRTPSALDAGRRRSYPLCTTTPTLGTRAFARTFLVSAFVRRSAFGPAASFHHMPVFRFRQHAVTQLTPTDSPLSVSFSLASVSGAAANRVLGRLLDALERPSTSSLSDAEEEPR
jgi:hypothetical protein